MITLPKGISANAYVVLAFFANGHFVAKVMLGLEI
jgi:hypothetical protein